MKKSISAILIMAFIFSYIAMIPIPTVYAEGEENTESTMSSEGKALCDAIDSGTVVIDGVEKTVFDVPITQEDMDYYGSYAIQSKLNAISWGGIDTSSAEDPVTPDDNTVSTDENTINPDDNTTSTNENIVDPDENVVDNTVVQEENTVDPDENVVDNTVVQDENTVDPDENVVDNTVVQDENTVDPDENVVDNTVVQDENTVDPDENVVDNTVVQDENTTNPDENITDPDDNTITEPVVRDYIFRVIVPAGNYNGALNIYSNTILDLRAGANIYSSGCTLSSPDYEIGKYDNAKNIIILGGSIHGLPQGTDISSHKVGYDGSCTIRFGHAKNISIVGTKIADNCGGHLVEVGAVKNLLIADCEFTGYADSTSDSNARSLEAIQLDVIHRESMNFSGYYPKDDYSVEDATIVNNYFHDLRRGVGSHHAVYGHPYKNIKIMGNRFENILDKAIQIEYCQNAVISDNTIEKAISGISFYSAFAGAFYLPNNSTERSNAKKNFSNTFSSNSIIENNTIHLVTRGVYNESWADKSKYGIRVFGDEFTTSNNKKGYESTTDTLPPNGIFYLSDVTARNNTISTVNDEKTSNLECCIRIRYAKKSNVEGNDINNAVSSSVTSGSGINVLKCNTCNVMSNKVKNTFNGISVTGSKNDKIEKNEVTTSLKNGITVVDGSVIESVSNNKIKGIPGTCISVTQKSTITSIYGNNISGNFTHGISVAESSTIKGNIKKNTVSGGNKNGIAINKSKVLKAIKENNISSAKAYGILLTASANVNQIYDNTISKTKKYGILVYDKSTCKEFGANKLSSCAYSNKINITSNSKGIALKKNTLTLNKGKSYTLKVAYKAANSKKITWATSDKTIATVKSGKITAKKKKGTVTITVYQNGAKSKCKVTVK